MNHKQRKKKRRNKKKVKEPYFASNGLSSKQIIKSPLLREASEGLRR